MKEWIAVGDDPNHSLGVTHLLPLPGGTLIRATTPSGFVVFQWCPLYPNNEAPNTAMITRADQEPVESFGFGEEVTKASTPSAKKYSLSDVTRDIDEILTDFIEIDDFDIDSENPTGDWNN